MSKNIKETLLGTLINGEKVLSDIENLKKTSPDKIELFNSVKESLKYINQDLLELEISDIIVLNNDTKSFRFVSTNNALPRFEAGQYLNVYVNIDGVRTSRPYSLSSPSNGKYYEITVARVKDGFVSNYMLDNLKVGDKLAANSPTGVFKHQPVFNSKKSLFLAGGSGITPFRAMLLEILNKGEDRDIVLLYGVRNPKVALFHDEFTKLAKDNSNFKYYLVVSDENAVWDQERGFIDRKLISRLVPDLTERTSFICGPEVMNEFCKAELESFGLLRKQIKREMFGGSVDLSKQPGYPNDKDIAKEFNIKIGDRTIKALSNESLLVALERNKVRMNVCCRSGECSLCRVKLVSGDIFLAKGSLQRKADEKYGYVHSCKTYPLSDLEIVL